jgi:hypothetical protein
MSWQAKAWAERKGQDYELEPMTRWVLVALGNWANEDGDNIFPSLATLEQFTGLSERSIRRHIKKLIAVGLLDYGDQSVVTDNPRYRNDQLPKVYRFVYVPAAQPDVSGVGLMPKKRRPWSRKPKPAPVDNPPARPERPDTVSRTPGQTGGHSVHQTNNPLTNPSAHADAGPPAEAVDYHAIHRLRAAARERLAHRGMVFTTPLFAPMPT